MALALETTGLTARDFSPFTLVKNKVRFTYHIIYIAAAVCAVLHNTEGDNKTDNLCDHIIGKDTREHMQWHWTSDGPHHFPPEGVIYMSGGVWPTCLGLNRAGHVKDALGPEMANLVLQTLRAITNLD